MSVTEDPDHCNLRSTACGYIVVRRTNTEMLGQRSFTHCQRTSHLEQPSYGNLQHGRVTELFLQRTEDVLLPQNLHT